MAATQACKTSASCLLRGGGPVREPTTGQHAHKLAEQDGHGARSAEVGKRKISQAAHKEPSQGMYGLEATHPQYPQIVRLPGEVAAKSVGQDGQA